MTDRALNLALGLLTAGVAALSTAVAVKDHRPPPAPTRLTLLATGDVWGEVEPCG